MKATDLLQQAQTHMNNRAVTYDQSGGERSMDRTVQAFNAITGRDLTVHEGWEFMACLKQVRLFSNPSTPHKDSAEDLVAYAALLGESMLEK